MVAALVKKLHYIWEEGKIATFWLFTDKTKIREQFNPFSTPAPSLWICMVSWSYFFRVRRLFREGKVGRICHPCAWSNHLSQFCFWLLQGFLSWGNHWHLCIFLIFCDVKHFVTDACFCKWLYCLTFKIHWIVSWLLFSFLEMCCSHFRLVYCWL